MKKVRNVALIKCVIWAIVWALILYLVASIIKTKTNYNLKDILFIEGIVIIAIGLLSSIGGNPMGLSINALGQANAQYISNANLEISKMEREKIHDNIKSSIRIGFSTIALCLGGAICIIINFII